MFFKNLTVYRLADCAQWNEATLEAALQKMPAKPCGSQQESTYGFAAPFGSNEDAPLVHASNGYLLVKTQQEDRVLPSSVVKDAVKEKVGAIEAAEARKVYKKEKDQIKDEVIQTLLPRAFIKKSHLYAAIDPRSGLLLVDASSPRKAEALLSALRSALGTLKAQPIAAKDSPIASFTQWVKAQEAPGGLFVLDECELRDTAEDGGIVRIKRDDLAGDEVRSHLDAGKVVTLLNLAWQDKLSFVLDEKLRIKRVRFEDLLQSQAEQDGGDDPAGQFDADFVLMMTTFGEFLPALLDALGGEETLVAA